MTDRLVVYTMAIGGDYELQPPPLCDGVDFFCFSDQDIPETNGWELVKVDLIIPSDKFRSSRDFKVRPHRWLGNYSRSIYVDSNVHLLQDPELLWDYLIPSESTVFGGFFHSYRETVSDEFTAVRDARLDYQSTLDFHKSVYRNHHVEVLHSKPVWGGLLARRHNDASCINAMETWYANILRFSRRDQLSLPLALSHLSSEQTTIVSNDNFETKFHRWPAGRNAKPAGYQVDEKMSPLKRMRISMSKKSRKFRKSLEKRGLLPSQCLETIKRFFPITSHPDVIFGFDKVSGLYFAKDRISGKRVFVSNRKRLDLYKNGIEHRQNWILQDYRIPLDLIAKDDVVIDVGANVGEIGIWVSSCGGKYIGFEPDPTAFSAMRLNVPFGQHHDVALSDVNGSATFFLNTAEADSSLYQPDSSDKSIKVKVATLDSFFGEIGAPSKIRLLKVEAEGMEPEALLGASMTLGVVEYIAVDAGPERGGENTVPSVLKILSEAGFEVIDCFLLRGTFLLKKK